MGALDPGPLTGLGQLPSRIVADGVEHAVTDGFAIPDHDQQGLVNQGGDEVDDLDEGLIVSCGDLLGR